MKKFFVLLIALLIVSGVMAQWLPQTSGTTNNLNSVYFTDASIGYAVGDMGTIIKTSNGGADWTFQNSGTNQNLLSVFFTDEETGYAVGDSNVLLKTDSGGIDWTNQNTGIQINLRGIYFPATDTGFAIGNNNPPDDSAFIYVLKTTNGGLLWSTCYRELWYGMGDIRLNSVFFVDANVGYTAGYIYTSNMQTIPIIRKTINGGNDWTSTVPGPGVANSIFFTSTDTGYLAGLFREGMWDYYRIVKTTNGGMSWTPQNEEGSAQSVFFTDDNTGYAVSGDLITKTINGGTDWSGQTTGTTSILNSIYFPITDTGYAVGESGTIIKTVNGGGLPVGISEKPLIKVSLKINPSPSSSTITISTPTTPDKNTILTIYNINGQQLLKRQITEQQTVVDVSVLSQGVYLVKVVTDDNVMVGKFVKR